MSDRKTAKSSEDMSSTEGRLVELQTRFAFQEDTLQALNEVIARQQQQIDALSRELKLHRDKLLELTDAQAERMMQGEAIDERPPHY